MNSFARARARMVEQVKSRGITDPRVLAVMGRVPREAFVGDALTHQAYNDTPLPIGEKQTISQPYMVALMTSALELKGHERVLEIGTGSGYQAAVLSRLARWVYSIERHSLLSIRAQRSLEALGCSNVAIKCGDGTLGWREFAPFDGILVTACGPEIPELLLEQLVEGGRLIIPIGTEREQILYRVDKRANGVDAMPLGSVRFVPLIGRFGFTRASTGP